MTSSSLSRVLGPWTCSRQDNQQQTTAFFTHVTPQSPQADFLALWVTGGVTYLRVVSVRICKMGTIVATQEDCCERHSVRKRAELSPGSCRLRRQGSRPVCCVLLGSSGLCACNSSLVPSWAHLSAANLGLFETACPTLFTGRASHPERDGC